MSEPLIAEQSQAGLLVVDMQRRLVPHIHEFDTMTSAIARVVSAARVFGIPIVATEQNRDGLGETIDKVKCTLPEDCEAFHKATFSVWGDEELRAKLRGWEREHVIVCGVEAHVCVQQTVLDLLRVDFVPFVLADAIGSRRAMDRDIAIERMRSAGAVITTSESIIMELQRRYDSQSFKSILEIIR